MREIILFPSIQQEYFQRPQQKGYKECNRYRICKITLDDFGLKIDNISDPKSRVSTQGVWSRDSVSITTPKETIKEDVDKPFCCKKK